MFRRRLFFIPILCLSSFAQAITTPEIAASALSPECVHYQIVGVCYWLFCSPFGCSVRTSVKVRHFRPDLVVSAYSVTGQNPWAEISQLSSPLPGIAEAGGDTNPRAVGQHSKVRFKNADAIGFPAGDALANFFSQFSYVCAPSSQPFLPYFLSTLDALAWRSGVPEMFYPESLTPGLREVSKDGDKWGNVYPRAGALSQTHDYKAGAVIAQRTADLVTRSGQPHVYIPLTATSHDGYWPGRRSRLRKATAVTINGRCWFPKNLPPARSSRMALPRFLRR